MELLAIFGFYYSIKSLKFVPGNVPMMKMKQQIKGTDFQLKAGECLLKIPLGKLSSYGHLAKETGNQKASRAVGTAVGSNLLAYLIPCHG